MAKANFINGKKTIMNNPTDNMLANQNAINYKGFFYGDNTEQKYYEGGAHFEYNDLCRRLNRILIMTNGVENEINSTIKEGLKENGIATTTNEPFKELHASRNKNIIAGSNTLKTVHLNKSNLITQMNTIGKQSLSNNNLFQKMLNGGDSGVHQGINNYKNENILVKQVEYYSKLTEMKIKDENKVSVKNNILNLKNSKDNIELKNNVYKNTTNTNNFNFLLMRSNPKNNCNLNEINKSNNTKSNNNLIENKNCNYKNIFLFDKKEINLQSRNHSYLNVQENSILRNTISKEYKPNVLDTSYTKINQIKRNVIKKSDFNKNLTISVERNRNIIKEKELDVSKFKSKQPNYTEIYNNKLSIKDSIIQNSNNSNSKSRNIINQIISKDSIDKYSVSRTLHVPENNRILKQDMLTKTTNNKNYYAIEKKSMINMTNKINSTQRDLKNSNFLISNYVKYKQPTSNLISLKKPASNTNLNKKIVENFNKVPSTINYFDISQCKDKSIIKDKVNSKVGKTNTDYFAKFKVESTFDKSNRHFSYGK